MHSASSRIENSAQGLHYKALRIVNVQQMYRFGSKLMSFTLSVASTLALTNTLAYYEIRTLQIRNVFTVQTPAFYPEVCLLNI
jgi:hypothetical protein